MAELLIEGGVDALKEALRLRLGDPESDRDRDADAEMLKDTEGEFVVTRDAVADDVRVALTL